MRKTLDLDKGTHLFAYFLRKSMGVHVTDRGKEHR